MPFRISPKYVLFSRDIADKRMDGLQLNFSALPSFEVNSGGSSLDPLPRNQYRTSAQILARTLNMSF